MHFLTRSCFLLFTVFSTAAFAVPQALNNPILFVTQMPIPSDFTTIASTFGNHRAGIEESGRGGDLYIRYSNGTLRNLTQEAGFGQVGFQGAASISVRDPAMHFSGTKAIFSMVIGAPTVQFQNGVFYWQLYEITGFGAGQTASISKVPNQPTDFNNLQAAYLNDGTIVFVSDRPRSGERHLYPQQDEYESAATPTGLWKLNRLARSIPSLIVLDASFLAAGITCSVISRRM